MVSPKVFFYGSIVKSFFYFFLSVCCLTPSEKYFSYTHGDYKWLFVEMIVMSALYKPTIVLVWFLLSC